MALVKGSGEMWSEFLGNYHSDPDNIMFARPVNWSSPLHWQFIDKWFLTNPNGTTTTTYWDMDGTQPDYMYYDVCIAGHTGWNYDSNGYGLQVFNDLGGVVFNSLNELFVVTCVITIPVDINTQSYIIDYAVPTGPYTGRPVYELITDTGYTAISVGSYTYYFYAESHPISSTNTIRLYVTRQGPLSHGVTIFPTTSHLQLVFGVRP